MNSRTLRWVGSRASIGSWSGDAENGGLSLDHCLRAKRCRSSHESQHRVPWHSSLKPLSAGRVSCVRVTPAHLELAGSGRRLHRAAGSSQHGPYPLSPVGKMFPEPSTVKVIVGRELDAGPRSDPARGVELRAVARAVEDIRGGDVAAFAADVRAQDAERLQSAVASLEEDVGVSRGILEVDGGVDLQAAGVGDGGRSVRDVG